MENDFIEILTSQIQDLLPDVGSLHYFGSMHQDTKINIELYFKTHRCMFFYVKDTNIMIELTLSSANYNSKYCSMLVWCNPDMLPSNSDILLNIGVLPKKIENFILTNLDILDNDNAYADNRKWCFYNE
jgi:hypothetical protein